MKVALVHDYLNQYGGAERVLEALLKIFPESHIYTLFYDGELLGGRFQENIYKTSILDRKLVARNHRLFIPFFPRAANALKIEPGYDLVIADTAGFAKGIGFSFRDRDRRRPYYLAYCHTPLRYVWETDDYFKDPVFRAVFRPVFRYVRNWDSRAAKEPDAILANSNFIARKIKDYYGRKAKVVYPPVDTEKFFYKPERKSGPGYYLAVGRLLHYKRFDLVIETFKMLGLPLKIAGIGPKQKAVQNQIARIYGAVSPSASGAGGLYAARSGNIELLPFVSDEELRNLYQRARALIFPQIEDFGLVAAEAQACGTPVIAYARGGALEIVKDGRTGVLFQSQRASEIIAAIRRCESLKFNRRKISREAGRFSFENFKKNLLLNLPPEIQEMV